MGVGIALDDFGTGYLSLSLLLDLPVDVVKIDRSFIRDIAHDRRAAALVRSVVTMCKALGIDTIAEGVETSAQLALVSALGCDFAQGFLFGRPGPVGSGSPGSGAGSERLDRGHRHRSRPPASLVRPTLPGVRSCWYACRTGESVLVGHLQNGIDSRRNGR